MPVNIPKSIVVSLEKKSVKRCVKDNGRGILPEKSEEIFTMFSQIDSFYVNAKGGLFIGLTLVKKLVDLHKGEIKAHNEGQGKGRAFTVSLPVIEYEGDKNGQKPGSDGNARKPKLLMVDDNVDLVTKYRIILNKEGYEFEKAYNGKEALEAFKQFKPDIAI